MLVLAPPAACMAWWLVWRRRYPDVARRSQQQRSRAARRTLHSLQQVRNLSGQPLATRAAAVMTQYLHERFDLAIHEPTPAEVREHLAKRSMPEELAKSLADYYRLCDAARFLPDHNTQPTLVAQASQLILAVEDTLCSLPPS
jgi:hypothetical protein